MSAIASPAWLSTELAYLNSQAHERLEEFAFHVAKDIEWLNDYALAAISTSERSTHDSIVKQPLQTISSNSIASPKIMSDKRGSCSPRKQLSSIISLGTHLQSTSHPGDVDLEEGEASMEISQSDIAADLIDGVPDQGQPQSKDEMAKEIPISVPEPCTELTELVISQSLQAAEPDLSSIAFPHTATDYLEPLNTHSPAKQSESRAGSLYFSATESPSSEISAKHERQSVAFASLPPRQPFAKKSLTSRSSQYNSTRSESVASGTVQVKSEPAATPAIARIYSTQNTLPGVTPVMKTERLSALPTVLLQEQPFQQAITASALPKAATRSMISPSQKEPRLESMSDACEEDEWLPKFDRTLSDSPKKTETLSSAQLVAADNLMPAPPKGIPTPVSKHAAGPIRAAMQAASAKASSYLRSARDAFGSPTGKHQRVFPSTTPLQSPPKKLVKAEPNTPALYPSLVTAYPKITEISRPKDVANSPSKQNTQRTTSPIKTLVPSPSKGTKAIPTPRKSPRKGNQAALSMATVAAKTAVAIDLADPVEASDVHSSPKRPAKIVPKLAAMPKSKPLSIRVATASQRDLPKKSAQEAAFLIPAHDEVQPDPPSRPAALVSKKLAPSKQIRALAAANQAKEKAEKEAERRETHRKEIERRRQENMKRLEEEEKIRIEQRNKLEDDRKRKATAERSGSGKKQLKQSTSRSNLRDPSPSADQLTDAAKTAPSALKRPLPEIGESQGNAEKRQCTNEGDSKASNNPDPRALRISLHKKDPVKLTFGAPGEPGYKRPGTYKPTEPIKFTAAPPIIPSESIELPEISSDYSDSDDEVKPPSNFVVPEWAESPELRKALRRQARVDPDDVFGPIQPLQMEEIFKGKERAIARFRPRSSSANWEKGDRLTPDEVVEYAKTMGYK